MATPAKSTSKPAPHGRVVGRYLMFGQIGSGGTATVHFGRLRGQGGFVRTVALKRLHAHLARDPYFVSLFLSEARLAARVSHPNVTSLLDVVCQDDGELLLVMDYVHGETLAGLLGLCRRREAAIEARIATAIIVGALAGLHAAHEAIGEDGHPLNLVHGDVSPHNVIVGLDGTPRMLDFGVARAGAASNQDRRVIGTLAYMAPERLRGTGFDRRSDVFSAGVLLWEMLAMRRLFSGCDGRTKRALSQIPPPSKYQPQIPRALDDVVLWALRSEATDRPEDALAFGRALESAVAPASNREIAEWLQQTAGARLRERSEELSRIERSSVPSLIEEDIDDLPTTAAPGVAPAPPPGWPLSVAGETADQADQADQADEEPTLYDPDLIARSQGAPSIVVGAVGARAVKVEAAGPVRLVRTTPILPRSAGPRTEPSLDLPPPRIVAPVAPPQSARLLTPGEHRLATSPGSPSTSPPPIADDDDLRELSAPPRSFERRRVVLGSMAMAGFAGMLWLLGRATTPTATAAQHSGPALARQLAVAAAPAAPAAPTLTAPPGNVEPLAPRPAAPAPAVTPPPAPPPAQAAAMAPPPRAGAGVAAEATPAPWEAPAAAPTAPAPPAEAPVAAAPPPAPAAAAPRPAPAARAAMPPRPAARTRSAPARAQARVTEGGARAARDRIVALNKTAMAAYESLEPQRALEQLRLALRLCKDVSLYQRELAGLTHTNLGVVLAGGFKQRDLAVRHFREARALMPSLSPSSITESPEIRAAFAEATRAER